MSVWYIGSSIGSVKMVCMRVWGDMRILQLLIKLIAGHVVPKYAMCYSTSTPLPPLSCSPSPPLPPVAESYVGRGSITKHIRIHGRGRFGIEHRRSAHYFLKLREGLPPPKKKRKKEDHKSFKTLKLINAGPRSIPNSL